MPEDDSDLTAIIFSPTEFPSYGGSKCPTLDVFLVALLMSFNLCGKIGTYFGTFEKVTVMFPILLILM